MHTKPIVPLERQRIDIFGVKVDVCTWSEIFDRIDRWCVEGTSRYICLCNVHSIVTAAKTPVFRQAANDADAATCDGMPIAWLMRQRGAPQQQRLSGPDLMWRYCERAAANGTSIFLYGATPDTLNKLSCRLLNAFPQLVIAGSYAPPFRELTLQEEHDVRVTIERSGARVVFVGLGCPKQELWMFNQRGKLRAVMLGVGAAFDYHAGIIKRAPLWMQNMGMEWLFRLFSEPRRLWRRYFVTNALFICYLLGRRRTYDR